MTSNDRPRVFLDVIIGKESAGRLVVELFSDRTPKTCENFRQLCTGQSDGLSYATCPFHRVIDEFMVQGGDISNGDGTGIVSIYGKEFEDENLDWRDMDAAGLVCSANRGKDTNGSQFFITLDAQPHLNGKHTIFGRLNTGQDVLQKMANVAVDDDDRPNIPVLISRCGELERKRKRQDDKPAAWRSRQQDDRTKVPKSNDRGRRRSSNDSDVEMKYASVSSGANNRRQSDNIVDEGLRGRPRARSGKREASQPIEDDTPDTQPHSPVKMHKRKRSKSPSRHLKSADREDHQYERRRRRSLPNQYDHDDNSSQYASRRHNSRREEYRENDRWRQDDGRLGDERIDDAPPVKFKGRGFMKYRGADRF